MVFCSSSGAVNAAVQKAFSIGMEGRGWGWKEGERPEKYSQEILLPLPLQASTSSYCQPQRCGFLEILHPHRAPWPLPPTNGFQLTSAGLLNWALKLEGCVGTFPRAAGRWQVKWRQRSSEHRTAALFPLSAAGLGAPSPRRSVLGVLQPTWVALGHPMLSPQPPIPAACCWKMRGDGRDLQRFHLLPPRLPTRVAPSWSEM